MSAGLGAFGDAMVWLRGFAGCHEAGWERKLRYFKYLATSVEEQAYWTVAMGTLSTEARWPTRHSYKNPTNDAPYLPSHGPSNCIEPMMSLV